MARKVLTIAAALALTFGLSAIAAQDAPAANETTITGEVIDAGCGKGAGHEACATKCIREGKSPAAIRTKDGVYTITGDYTAEKHAKLIPFVAKNVEAKGVVTKDKDGKMSIKVTSMAEAK